ncbi:MAG: glycosyltransferase, partial [Bryobacteraceae bacterium]
MRIGIDATPLLIRSAGVKNYLYRWIAGLRAAASGDKIEAFPFLRSLGALDHEHSVAGRVPTFWRLLLLHLANTAGAPVLEPLTSRYDVFHASNLIRHRPRRILVTATVYDFTCRLMPQFHTAANIEADRLLGENIFAKADGLIAISENTRADAVRFLGIPADRIAVIYPGVPDEFFRATPTKRAKPYVLSLGTIEPRKNIDTLLDAWLALSPSIRDEYELVVAGPVGWSSDNTMARIRGGMPGIC